MELPSAESLAIKFAELLKKEVGLINFAMLKFKNWSEIEPSVCHSHDYCDANMVMDAAFQSFGIDPLPDIEAGMSQEVVDRWNEAWDFAKDNYLGGTKSWL